MPFCRGYYTRLDMVLRPAVHEDGKGLEMCSVNVWGE